MRLRIRRASVEVTKTTDAQIKPVEKQINISSDDVNSFIDSLGKTPEEIKPKTIIDNQIHVPEKEPDPEVNKMMVNYSEKMPRINWNKGLLYLSMLGIMGIVMFTMYLQSTPMLMMIALLFGMMCFFPIGLIIGWLFFSIDTRVLILRRMRGKNYGIVNFVNRGGQRMVQRVKNFDYDVIVQDTKMWILQNDGIYYITRDRQKIKYAAIESKNIKTMPSGIPMLYLDSDTMIPLTLHAIQSKSNPQQVGAVVLGYINNQVAKMIAFKKGMQMFFIIILVLCAVSMVVGFQCAMWLSEMNKEIPILKADIEKVMDILNREYGNETVFPPLPFPGG